MEIGLAAEATAKPEAPERSMRTLRPRGRLGLDRSQSTAGLIGAIALLALALRLAPWLANLPLHHDEALYGAWARAIADGSDPLLLIPWIDKPPLVLYLLAAGIRAFGASELALRAPGMIAALLTVWATFGFARRLFGVKAALLAAAAFALSPFAILFAPTAFTDPWLTLFLVGAAWAALAGRPAWAGALAGLAAASKQQGLFALPLVLALVATTAPRLPSGRSGRRWTRWAALGPALLGFGLVFGLVTYWDSLRWHNRPSYWDQSLRTYGGVALAAAADWPRRLGEWGGQVALLFGAWWITAPALALGAAAVVLPTGRRDQLLILVGYIVAYFAVHVAFTFQPWDRYLLPILPLVCALVGRGLLQAPGWAQTAPAARAGRAALATGAAAVALYAASLGVTAAIPVGSDVGAYRGVAEAAAFLAGQPGRPTVYHDHLGWHLDYYLYGLPVTRSWFDSPQKLASEAARVAVERPGSTQWLALPRWEDAELTALEAALAARGFEAEPTVQIVAAATGEVDLTLYRLTRAGGQQIAATGRGELRP